MHPADHSKKGPEDHSEPDTCSPSLFLRDLAVTAGAADGASAFDQFLAAVGMRFTAPGEVPDELDPHDLWALSICASKFRAALGDAIYSCPTVALVH